tara:strand:- start:210 stop:614 length:405 start_codon:yes stop_codon:yes gene_type:complete
MSKYYESSDDIRFKVKITHVLPFQINKNRTNSWINMPLPKRISIVFTPRGVLIKKYNKIIICIPYHDIGRYCICNNRMYFHWTISKDTVIYKNQDKFKKYFENNDFCILYMKSLCENPITEINYCMEYYKLKYI